LSDAAKVLPASVMQIPIISIPIHFTRFIVPPY